MNATRKTNNSSEQFREKLQQITSPQAREFIVWVLQRLTGPDADKWAVIFKKVFKGM